MAKKNWFANALADVRRELVENAWFGKPDARDFHGNDRVLNDKLFPDKIADRGILGWLEAEPDRGPRADASRAEPPQPHLDRGIDR